MDTAVYETTVAERIAHALRRHDVEVIFGQSLPSAVILAAEKIGITQIAYRQENMGGAMADGYARRSGKIGIVAAQNGLRPRCWLLRWRKHSRRASRSLHLSRMWSVIRLIGTRFRTSITSACFSHAQNGFVVFPWRSG